VLNVEAPLKLAMEESLKKAIEAGLKMDYRGSFAIRFVAAVSSVSHGRVPGGSQCC
jgi:hypothetical protein